MRTIYYNSDITPSAINEIKLLALYYDKVVIVNDAVYTPKFETIDGKFQLAGVEDIQFIPKTFERDYNLLIDEGIIDVIKKDENEEDEYGKRLAKKISSIVNSSQDIIFPNHPNEKDSKIITKEVYEVMKYMFDYEWGKPVEVNIVWWYYSLKLKWFLKLLMEGENCLSSSNNLNILFKKFIKEISKSEANTNIPGRNRSLALDAFKLGLPNPDLLSFDDILELKIRLKDELNLFKQTINSIEIKNKELLTSDVLDEEYQNMVFIEIQKPLSELKNKIINLNSRTFRKFIERMQNPKTYAPLIGTVVAGLPLQYALLSSLGLTTGVSYLEYKEEKRELQSNGLYFLLKGN